MKKILWFSRHTMTAEQRDALPPCEITQINGTMPNVHVPFEAVVTDDEGNSGTQDVGPFKVLVDIFDIIAIVAPIAIQHQILTVAGGKPVIMAKSKRIIEKSEDGAENKVIFVFDGWERLIKIDVVTEPFVYE